MDQGFWRRILEKYGQKVTIRRGEEETHIRAFFQPVAEKAAGEMPTPLGMAPVGKYLYLGPAEEKLEDAEELIWEGRTFRFIRNREIPVGDTIFYRWAVAEELDRVEA